MSRILLHLISSFPIFRLVSPSSVEIMVVVFGLGSMGDGGLEPIALSSLSAAIYFTDIMERVPTRSESSDTYRQLPGYGQQYTSLYSVRLDLLRPALHPPESWSQSGKHVKRVLDLAPGEPAWIVGTITRETAHKPNILEDLKKITHGLPPNAQQRYCSPHDKIYLEDDHGRIEIVGAVKKHEFLVTGIVVALFGAQNAIGEFEALEVTYPSLPGPTPVKLESPSNRTENGRKVALISGLYLDDVEHEGPALQMLIEHLAESPEVSRIIISGNSLSAPKEELVGSRILRPTTSADALTRLDTSLAMLASLMPVHVMPGASDPTTIAFPQMPLHPSLFKFSKPLVTNLTLDLATNPQNFAIDGRTILGTSGQPIQDLLKYTFEGDGLTELDLLHKTLLWGHVAPTAPDTLWSYPYVDDDPMVLRELPQVYFAGNCSKFATDTRDSVRLVCIPPFSTTGTAVLLDLDTLEVEELQFS